MSAESTIEDIITEARDFATSSYEQASDLIDSAQSAAGTSISLTPRTLEFLGPDPEDLDHGADPGYFEDGFTLPVGRPDSPKWPPLHPGTARIPGGA